MISNFPIVPGVFRSEFADDLAIFIAGDSLQNITEPLQRQINLIVEWAKNLGLVKNISGKTWEQTKIFYGNYTSPSFEAK